MAAPAARAWAMPVRPRTSRSARNASAALEHLIGEGQGRRVLGVELPLERDLDHVEQGRLDPRVPASSMRGELSAGSSTASSPTSGTRTRA